MGSSDWTSMGIPSDGNTYGVPDNLIFSFPVTIKGGEYKIVDGLKLDDAFSKEKIKKTTDELLLERDMLKLRTSVTS